MLNPNSLEPDGDQPSDDPDRARAALGRGLVASRDLMRRSSTLIALASCQRPTTPRLATD